MLILTRKSGECINIGPDVKIRVLEIRGNQARLGIEAPRHVAVHREEVYQQVQKRNEMAARRSPESLSDVRMLWMQKRPAKSEPGIQPADSGSENE